MRTVNVNLYRFSELSTEAQERAVEEWRDKVCCDIPWSDEWRGSIKTFCDYFGVDLISWHVDEHQYSFKSNERNDNFRGMRLRDFNRDHMPTGYVGDCPLWVTFYDQFKATGDAKTAFKDALDAGFEDWQKDIQWLLSDKGIIEQIEAIEYEFHSDGSLA